MEADSTRGDESSLAGRACSASTMRCPAMGEHRGRSEMDGMEYISRIGRSGCERFLKFGDLPHFSEKSDFDGCRLPAAG